ncbi:MAG TPA: hypothetical protein VFB79_13270 [Candidatus Angelobacter sp.]|nr:hypothetical protein [Candidatus Angelobacter sp.]
MVFFYFLGADPELSYDFLDPEEYPDATEINRKLVLSCLSVICCLSQKRKLNAEGYRKLWALEVWWAEQLWPHVPKEVQKRLLIERDVNETDPDFYFFKAAFGVDPKPLL